MQSAAQYLEKTRSAALSLFDGINAYLNLLRVHSTTFATSFSSEEDFQTQFDAWYSANQPKIQADLEAQKQFLGESFAQATLCGAVLQLAAKAIECYSTNIQIPSDWESIIKPDSKTVRFCKGRLIRGVPLGLIVCAGRNQHMHFEDQNLREPNVEVFRRLAANHGYGKGREGPFLDPSFQLGAEGINSFANNITALLDWRTLEAYENDMRDLLEI